MLVPLVILTVICALAIGIWTSGLNVKYRDVRYALPFFIQLWMYASPVIYPTNFVPPQWRWLLVLNPMTGIIEGYRSALFNRPLEWQHLAVSADAQHRVAGLRNLFIQANGAGICRHHLKDGRGIRSRAQYDSESDHQSSRTG